METKKAYFVNNDTEELFELSPSKRKQLDKLFPNWTLFNCENNYDDVHSVYDFFKQHGKLVGHPQFKNVFVGLLE